uniref:Reverse transcriptase zinc-binding domain-containing protein n=1 Tax=Cannabis sativa TaxID=3483 RepID=A0A803P0V8_CANSA
ESMLHLFFECRFAQSCLQELKTWLGWRSVNTLLPSILRGINRARQSKFKKNCYIACVAAAVCKIWNARNKKFWCNEDNEQSILVQETKWLVKNRITC